MQINYKQVVIWDPEIIDVAFLGSEQSVPVAMRGLAIGAVKITDGAPAQTPNQWAVGALVQNASDGFLYRNEGTTVLPVWATDTETSVTLPTTFSGSYQIFAADLTLEGDAGGAGNFLAGMMGNLHGNNLTQVGNEEAGLIGAYSVTGTNDSTYPKAAVIGDIGSDGGTCDTADGAFVAVLNGGNGGVAQANAAYGVDCLNNDASSKFNYGFDFYKPSHDGYQAISFAIADGRLSNGCEVFSGVAATRAAVRAQVGDSPLRGSIYFGNAAAPGTTKPNVYIKVLAANADTDWERVVTAATD